uniref:glucuronosyltransferase n=1 Tax=Parastrongyloides trichosuri TaxID=131310 RepID=A0A0N4Z9H4_PARTI
MVSVANLLSEAGHDVTLIQSPMNPAINDNNVKGPKIIRPSIRNVDLVKGISALERVNKNSWIHDNTNPLDIISELYDLSKWLTSSCENTIIDPELTVKMREEHFDLGISEFFAPCGLGVLKYFNVKNTITVSSGSYFDCDLNAFGITQPVSQLPTVVAPFPQKMNLMERIINFFTLMALKRIQSNSIEMGNKLFDRIYPEGQVDLYKLFQETSFYIVNSDPIINYGAPLVPKVLQLGGFLIPEVKNLSQEMEELLGRRSKNVIISFGSIAKSSMMTDKMKHNLVRLFEDYPHITFLWKYDEDRPEFLNRIENVVTFKWLPQIDLLADDRISLFVTHGGMNSMLEASKFGVPMLDIPLFGDQPRNAKVVEELKLGRLISKFDFNDNYDLLKKVFDDLINNEIYMKTTKKTSAMINKRPYNPRQTFIKYVEFASEFGNVPNFSIPNSDIPLWQFYYLDVFGIIGFIIVILVQIYKAINRTIGNLVCSKKAIKRKDE